MINGPSITIRNNLEIIVYIRIYQSHKDLFGEYDELLF